MVTVRAIVILFIPLTFYKSQQNTKKAKYEKYFFGKIS
jgi:hypothetical protein